jgi:hypothetical protein
MRQTQAPHSVRTAHNACLTVNPAARQIFFCGAYLPINLLCLPELSALPSGTGKGTIACNNAQ